MDFIEQWFGISPDNGNGCVEFLYIVAVAIVGAIVWRRWSARHSGTRMSRSSQDRPT